MLKVDLIIVGKSNVGKTALARRFLSDNKDKKNNSFGTFESLLPTVGVDLFNAKLTFDDKNSNQYGKEALINIWDTAGQEKFRSLTRGFFNRADAVIIVYDITDSESFFDIKNENGWLDQITENCNDNVVKMLIGNKIDLEESRIVQTSSGQSLADSYQIDFLETSNVSGVNVKESIYKMAEKVLDNILTSKIEGVENMDQSKLDKNGQIVSEKGSYCSC